MRKAWGSKLLQLNNNSFEQFEHGLVMTILAMITGKAATGRIPSFKTDQLQPSWSWTNDRTTNEWTPADRAINLSSEENLKSSARACAIADCLHRLFLMTEQ